MNSKSLFVIALAVSPVPALAQAADCRPVVTVPPYEISRPDARPRRTPVAGYLLSLSWSPEYCRTRVGSAGDRLQCGGAGRFGFIVHGLWPEAAGSDYPRYCQPASRVPEPVVRQHLCMTPSADLIQHEWQKHGSCGWSDPARYLAAADSLWRALDFPDMDVLSRRGVTAGEVARAFAEANPGLPIAAVRIKANRRQWLQEVQLCLGPDFRPRACPAHVRGVEAAVPVSIWRGGSTPRR